LQIAYALSCTVFKEAGLSSLFFSAPPDRDEAYRVGDHVEVMCDHEFNGDRVRDWLMGTVVQVDPKMIAVQFQQNVYLTDGWMVPDHVLWCPKGSNNVRKPLRRRRKRPNVRVTVRTKGEDDDLDHDLD
jgi:hypothetical protein